MQLVNKKIYHENLENNPEKNNNKKDKTKNISAAWK